MLELGCLRKWLLEFRESRNFIRKWSYFREISSNFVYFRITFYTTFRIIWHDFHTKVCIPSNKYLTNNKYLWLLGLYWVLKLYKNERNWNSNSDPKSIFWNGIRNKKTFEIYEISSIQNVVNTLFSTDDIFYTQQRNFKTLIGGGGGTTIHPSTPFTAATNKKIGITSHRISQNTAEFCIDLHRKISYNFAKFGPFSNGIRNKKKHSKYTKFRVYEMS